ncbi:hypothetical protein Tco_0536809 [Tanacetum coccineum]
MISDHNSSDLAPQRQEMSVENVSSGLVPQGQKASDYDNSDPVPPRQNVVPTAEKTDSSQQGLEFELYFVRTEYQLADMFTKALPEDRFKYLVRRIGIRCLTPADLEVVRLGINPMIQPEPEDLPKDNPKLEIAVLRVILFSIHNDEWKSFQCHHQTALRRTIDQAADGKLRDKNDEKSWALLEDLALYDNESWNDPRYFAKPVKAISMPQDVPSTSDRHLIELENQICSGPHDTHYFMENPEQAFVKYASSHTDEAGGLMSNFMASQDDKISRFKSNFKQYQSEMTNKLDTFLKAFNDQMTGALPSNMIKSLKLNPNSTSSTRSYPKRDPQSSPNSFKSINAIQTCFNSTTNVQRGRLQVNTLTVNEIETPTRKEPEKAIKDEFADMHLNLPVLEVLARVLIYDALLDKYIVRLELGKNGFVYIQSIAPKKMKDPELFILPCRLWDSKPFDTLADLGLCVNLIPLSLFKKLKI